MRPFTYERPATLADAVSMLADGDSNSRFLAGGTDLLTLMKHDLAAPDRLVDIKRLPDLDDTIAAGDDGLRIGALATLARIEKHTLVRERYGALAEAAALAATPQLRNMATIGGNLLQRPRCWYFRSPHVECWLKGGHDCPARDGDNRYHALFGDSPCVAVHPSDPATAFLVLDASVEIAGPDTTRAIPVGELFALPTEGRRTETTLHRDEMITAILLPPRPATATSAYLKAMDRKVWAFATVAVAASLEVEDGVVRSARLALGGVAPVPWDAPEAASLLVGQSPSDDLYGRVASAALDGATSLTHNGYKVPLLKALIHRALATAAPVR